MRLPRASRHYRRHGKGRPPWSSSLAMLFVVLARCTALSTDVTISTLKLAPADIRETSTVEAALAHGDYRRALELSRTLAISSSRDVLLVARAEIATGRFSEATARLTKALEDDARGEIRRDILWELSQVAYLANDFSRAHAWAVEARKAGLGVMDWHVELLHALAQEDVYRSSGTEETTVAMIHESPAVPRIDVSVNGRAPVAGIVDSGAILSIVSESLARDVELRSLGRFKAIFYGLAGDPIDVRFGLLDSLRIGSVQIDAIPVAVMPDDKLSFFMRELGEYRADLILGATLLKEFRLSFDYGRGRLMLEHLAPRDHAPATDQNLFFVDFRPFVHATINRKGWYPFLLDTGSEITFLNGDRLRVTDVPGIPKPHKSILQGLGGAQRHGTRLNDIEIGVDRWGGLFKHLPLYDDNRTGAVGIIGQNFLNNFNVVVDFGRMKVELMRRRR